jgi:hypothetical protein
MIGGSSMVGSITIVATLMVMMVISVSSSSMELSSLALNRQPLLSLVKDVATGEYSIVEGTHDSLPVHGADAWYYIIHMLSFITLHFTFYLCFDGTDWLDGWNEKGVNGLMKLNEVVGHIYQFTVMQVHQV